LIPKLTDEATGHSELKVVMLSKQSHNSAIDWLAPDLALLIFLDDTGSNLDFISEL
jgi:hypothetical protein